MLLLLVLIVSSCFVLLVTASANDVLHDIGDAVTPPPVMITHHDATYYGGKERMNVNDD